MQYLDLKMDFMFKQLFGHPSRKSITMAFLTRCCIGQEMIESSMCNLKTPN